MRLDSFRYFLLDYGWAILVLVFGVLMLVALDAYGEAMLSADCCDSVCRSLNGSCVDYRFDRIYCKMPEGEGFSSAEFWVSNASKICGVSE